MSHTVSVVITCYNQAEYLAESVRSVTIQTLPACETIVVDDGSTDATRDVASSHGGVQLISQVNQGLAAARNTGLQAARGTYIVFLDADDRLRSEALARGLEAMQVDQQLAFAYGHYRYIDQHGALLKQWAPAPVARSWQDFLRGNPIGMHATVIYERAKLLDAGGFRPSLRECEDYDLYLRLARQHPWARHTHVVAEYRQHLQNMSHNAPRMLRTVLQVLAEQAGSCPPGSEEHLTWLDGKRNWRRYYAARYCHAPAASPTISFTTSPTHPSAAKASETSELSLSPRQQMWRLARREMIVESAKARFQAIRDFWRRFTLARLVRWSPWHRVALGDFQRQPCLPSDRDPQTLDSIFLAYALPWVRHRLDRLTGRGLIIGAGNADVWQAALRTAAPERGHLATDSIQFWDCPVAAAPLSCTPAEVHPNSRSFDWIIVDRALQFRTDMAATLEQLADWLSPGGTFIGLFSGVARAKMTRPAPRWWVTPYAAEQLLRHSASLEWKEVDQGGNVASAIGWINGLPASTLQSGDLPIIDPQYPLFVATWGSRRVIQP